MDATRLTAAERDMLRSNPQTLLRKQGVPSQLPQKQPGGTKVTYRP